MANGKRNILPAPFGSLDVQTADIDAPDGMLRLLKNLIRRGNKQKSYYGPAEKEKEVYKRDDAQDALRGVRAIHVQVRQRIGALTGGQAYAGDELAAGWHGAGDPVYEPAALPTPRQAAVTVELDGKIHVIGGRDAGGYLSTHEAFDPVTNTWTTLASLPDQLAYGMGGEINGKIYFAGGWDGVAYSTLYEYDPETDTWTAKASMPAARESGAGAAVAGKLLIAGGGNNDDLYSYDPVTNTWSSLALMPADYHRIRGAEIDGLFYVAGGLKNSTTVTTDTLVYDPDADTWTVLAALPVAIHRHTVFAYRNKLYAAAGELSGGAANTKVYEYDPVANAWTELATLPTNRQFYTMGYGHSTMLFILGGGSTSANGLAAHEAYAAFDTIVPGTATLGLPSSSERIIALTDTHIYALEPASSYEPTELYEFPDALKTSKKAQFTQIGDVTFIAVSVGGGLGLPTPILVLIDDQVLPFELPPLPAITITENGSAGKLEAGRYGVRFAWILKDGTVAKASRPYTINVSADAELQFAISAYRAALEDYWSEIISGVQIAVSQVAATGLAVELMNTPYYRVAQIRGLEVGKSAKWTDAGDNIPTYPLFEDDTLMNHGILAAAVISYNKRLVLGDIAYDFEQPDPLAQAINPDSIGTSTNLAPTFSWWFIDDDDDGQLDDEQTGNNVVFTCVGKTLDAAIEIEDADGLLTRVAYDDSNDPGGDTIPDHAAIWEGWNGTGWDFLTFGTDEDTTPGYAKKRLRIFFTPGPELEGRGGINFKMIAEDDDFGYSERGYAIGIFPAGFCDG